MKLINPRPTQLVGINQAQRVVVDLPKTMNATTSCIRDVHGYVTESFTIITETFSKFQ